MVGEACKGRGMHDANNVFSVRLTASLPASTLLVVAGDHGMTTSGDHGGDSEDETAAALFLYARDGLHEEVKNSGREVRQIDLVPTLSLLLDSPIPFSSLGALIPELYAADPPALRRAARANAWQVARYAENYQKFLRDGAVADRLKSILKILYSLDEAELTAERCADIVKSIHAVFEGSWAKFHRLWIAVGLLVLLDNFLFSVLLLLRLAARKPPRLRSFLVLVKAACYPLMIAAVWARHEAVPPIMAILVALQIALTLHSMASELLCVVAPLSVPTLLCTLLVLAGGTAHFSNSFVVWEAAGLRFLTASAFVVVFWGKARPLPVSAKRDKKLGLLAFLEGTFGKRELAAVGSALCLLRLTAAFNRCREEQGPLCRSSLFTLPFASLSASPEWQQLRFVLGVGALVSLSGIFYYTLRRRGHLSGFSFNVAVLRFMGVAATVLICCFWTTFWLPDTVLTRYANFLQIGLPLSIYALLAFGGVVLWFRPLLTDTISQSALIGAPAPLFRGGELDQSDVFRHVRTHAAHYLGDKPSRLFVFGLGTGPSGALTALLWLWALLLALLLGEGMGVPLLCLGVAAGVALAVEMAPGSRLCLLSLLSCCAFGGLGGSAVFSALPWGAAFIGLPGDFAVRALQAAPVLLNVTAGSILGALLVPLGLVLGADGELRLLGGDDAFFPQLLAYATLMASRALLASLAAAVHCRHLMVWKIFAPKFVFEGVSFLVGLVFVLVGGAFAVRLRRAVARVQIDGKM